MNESYGLMVRESEKQENCVNEEGQILKKGALEVGVNISHLLVNSLIML